MSKILIVDDDPDYSEMLLSQLSELGHETIGAGTLQEGLKAARTQDPDVVFLDVGLPDGSGLTAIGSLMQIQSRPEVIIVTGRGSSDGAELAIRGGAWDYICKGSSFKEVLLSLRRILDFRREKQAAAPRILKLDRVIGRSAVMRRCFDQLGQAAGSEANVLLFSETGAGKEAVALAIHENSSRAAEPFVVVDCSALPENLVESMLFGHERGAFTGADQKKEGLIKAANQGTLFLDEIGELPLAIQKAFLRVLQERAFRPVGSIKEITSNFRLIAATNRDLDKMVQAGSFREDLLFRLRTISITIPPLRDRKEDIWLLLNHFMIQMQERYRDGLKGISPEFLEAAGTYHWPGNVRELRSALESSYLNARGSSVLFAVHLPLEIRVQLKKELLEPLRVTSVAASPALPREVKTDLRVLVSLDEHRAQAEKNYLLDLLNQTHGDMTLASGVAGVSVARLYAMLKKHNVALKRFKQI